MPSSVTSCDLDKKFTFHRDFFKISAPNFYLERISLLFHYSSIFSQKDSHGCAFLWKHRPALFTVSVPFGIFFACSFKQSEKKNCRFFPGVTWMILEISKSTLQVLCFRKKFRKYSTGCLQIWFLSIYVLLIMLPILMLFTRLLFT